MNLSKAFTRREKVLLTILALLLVAAVYFLAVHRPVNEALARMEGETQIAETELTVLQAKAARLAKMKQELEAILADGQAAQIPDYNNLQQLMTFLNAVMAGASDYDLSFQAVDVPEDGTVLRRTARMDFICPSYDSARSILEALGDCPFRCLANDLSVAPYVPAGTRADPSGRAVTDGAVQVGLTVTFFERLP